MIRARHAALLVGALLGGCGDSPPAERPAVVGQVSPSPAEPAPAAAAPELAEVPRPDLAPLDEPVRRQVERELAELDSLLADPSTPPDELAGRFGRLARIYHGYGLREPARVAYRNAAALDPEEFRWQYLGAVVAQLDGDNDAAAKLLERALELAPDDQPTRLRLAEVRLLNGDPESAGKLFQATFDRQPDSAAALHGLARLAAARGEHRRAAEMFERVLELQPEASSVRILLAQALRRLGERAAADRQVALRGPMQVTFDDPLVEELETLRRGVGIHLERAIRAFGDERWNEAVAEYRTALELEPKNATGLRGLGLTLAAAGRHAEAAEAYRRMLEVYPEHQLARLEYGTSLLESGREAAAIAPLEAAIRSDPDFKDAHFNLAIAQSRLERWERAANGFREVLRLDRDHVRARFSLGVALDELDRPREAAAELERALAAEPAHLAARQRLGAVLERLGRRQEALEQFRAVLGLDVPDQEKALAHYQIGRLLDASGRDQEALTSFERAVELFPEFWQARFAVANWLARHGRPAEAADIFGRLAAADPSNILAREQEAVALIGAGRFALARRKLEEGLAAHPRSFELASLLARLLATAPDAALRDGPRALDLAQRLLEARRGAEQAETVAMALAEVGRFDEAAALQRRLVDQAESEGLSEVAARLRVNLRRYESGEPLRGVFE